MTFTAEQYSQIAQKAAADPSITPEKREELARKAEWFRFLSDRLGGTRRPGGTVSEGEDRSETRFSLEPPSPPPKRSLRLILTTLWVTGAAIYLIAMFQFTNTVVNLFRQELEDKPSYKATRPVSSPRAVASNQQTGRGQPAVPPSSPAPHRRHAISPDDPRYEAPGLIVPPAIPEQDQTVSAPGPAPTNEASAPPPETSAPEIQATGTATARNGPSSASKVIGTATVTPAAPEDDKSSVAVTRSEQAPSLTAQEPKPAKQRVRKKPSAPAEVAKQRPSRPPARDRAYADVPEDEEFIADTPPRRNGFFARRRLLREGLMSPGFIPPR
jgi:hypothetical protein